jgi:hypothetical protein
MSNAESMTEYECCSVRCRQRSRRAPVIHWDSSHYSFSVVRDSPDFLLENLRGSD